MEATYVRLGYIDDKATIFVLRVAFAFLAAASLFALVATFTYIKAANTAATYVAGLSAIINAVAAWHYNEIVKVRLGKPISIESEWMIDVLRHSDWAVTMPLLVLKLYALINNPEHDLILGSVDASALCACIMILLGAYSRLLHAFLLGLFLRLLLAESILRRLFRSRFSLSANFLLGRHMTCSRFRHKCSARRRLNGKCCGMGRRCWLKSFVRRDTPIVLLLLPYPFRFRFPAVLILGVLTASERHRSTVAIRGRRPRRGISSITTQSSS